MTNNSSFSTKILNWFDVHGRHDLPWQHNKTLYRVWVSEIMLQQTQVTTAIPYYEKFMARFPDVAALAKAPQDDVLQHWAGLGYYARARNLHKAAIQIMTEHDGQFPEEHESLVALPGIGRSTAGAILSLTLNQRHPILDGNVKRVLTRFGAIAGWPSNKKVEDVLWQLADKLTPQQRVDDYNQAMMDMGATLCTRAKPLCLHCPVNDDCEANAQGKQADFPNRKPKKAIPTKQTAMLILKDGDEIFVEQRPPSGIWGGLWTLPESDVAISPEQIESKYMISANRIKKLPEFRYTFSHYHLDIQPILVDVQRRTKNFVAEGQHAWVDDNGLKSLGLPAPVTKLLKSLAETNNSDR